MAELLGSDGIERALATLPGWSFADGGLVKRAVVPEDLRDGLVKAVGRVSDELNHHPEITREPDTVTFRLWTHSAGGVTAKDVDLAARIDQLLASAPAPAGDQAVG